MRQPSIAIVTPVLNEKPVLQSRLDAWRALQQYAEIMLCDGGSDDGTWEWLQSSGFPCVQSPAGRARQMNAGVVQTTGDVLLFVHADTLLDASHVQAVRQVMQKDKAVVGGRFDVCLSGSHPAFRVIETAINIRSRWSGISTGDQCQFIRRDIFERLGGFEDIPLMEDVALSKAMKQQGRIACLKQKVVTSSRRWEKHGVFRTVLLMWKLRLLYWLGVSPEKLIGLYH